MARETATVKTATVTDELRIEISADTGNATQNISNTADALSKFGDNAKSADSDVTKLVRAMSDEGGCHRGGAG